MTTYTITLTDGTVLTMLPPQTVDTTHTSITLIGQGTETYGAYLNDNLVHMIEHFANTTPPPHPLVGQLWYNLTTQSYSVWNGSAWTGIPPQLPPNDAAIIPTLVGVGPSILAYLAAGKVLAVFADRTISNGSLPTTITYRNIVYPFASQFPSGVGAGMTISSVIELSPSDNSDTLVTSKWVKQQGYQSAAITFGQVVSALGYTPLDPDDNLAELTNAGIARTNLGLGSMATQSSTSISVTGGTLNGVTIGGITPGAGSFTTLTLTGSQSAKNVLAAPNATAGAPSWRQLIASDVSGAEAVVNKGVPNGYASLDSLGFVPLSQIPSVAGGVTFKGTWNAASNTPALASGVGTQGFMYVVSIAGNTNLDGNTGWQVGDYAIFNGTAWQRIPNSVPVTSVAGRTGNVVLSISDISGGAPLASPIFTGNPTASTPATPDNSTSIATTAFVKNQNYISINDNITITGVVTGSGITSINLSYAPVTAKTIIANISDISASPQPVGISSLFDNLLGNTQGNFAYRNATTWTVLAPGTAGQFLQTQGNLANPQWAGAITSFNSRTGAITLTGVDVTTALGYTPLSANQTITLTGAVSGSGTTAITTQYSNIANNTLLANTSGILGPPIATTPTILFDNVFGNDHGSLIYRNASAWLELVPGIAGQVLTTNGASANPSWTNVMLSFNSRSGNVTLTSSDVTTALGFTPISGNQTITLSGVLSGSGATSIAAGFAPISTGTAIANVSGITAAPIATPIQDIIDSISATQGSVLYRNAVAWVPLNPGTVGQVLQTEGPSANLQWASTVLSFNTRTGAVTLTSSDITTALGFTPLSGNQTITISGAVSGSGTTSITTSFSAIADNSIISNISGGSAAAIPNSFSNIVDHVVDNTQGDLLYRNASGWVALTPGTNGQVLQTQGASANPHWTNVVLSFNTRTGAVTLTSSDVTTALGFTPLSGNQTITISGAVSGSGTTSISTSFASIAGGTVLSNVTGSPAAPVANSVSSVLDIINNVQGDLLYRNAAGWVTLAPGSNGQVLQTQGAAANPQWANTVSSVTAGTGLSGGTITTSGTIALAPIASNDILANLTVGSAAPTGNSLTAIIDTIGNAQGDLLYRNGSVWTVLATGTSGQYLQTQGASANPQWANAVTSVATGTGLTGGPITTSGTIALASIANSTVLANTSGISAAPSSTTVSTLLDSAIDNTQGDILYRNASSWTFLGAGTNGQVLQTQGASANPHWTAAVLSFNTRTGAVTLTSGDVTTALGFTPLSGNQTITLSGVISGVGTTAITTSFEPISGKTVWSNVTGSSAAPVANSISSILDTIDNTQGDILYRDLSSWLTLPAGTNGQVLQTQGASANPQWATIATSFNTRTGAITLTATDVNNALGYVPLSGNQNITITGVVTGSGTTTINTSFASISNNTVLSNVSGISAAPVANTVTSIIDSIGSTQGEILYRGSSVWSALGTGTNGQFLQTQGAGANPQWKNAVTSVAAGTGLAGGTITSTGIISLGAVSSNQVLANIGAGSGVPIGTSLTALIDTINSTQGSLLYRGASTWTAIGPGTSGQVLQTQGASANPQWTSAVLSFNTRTGAVTLTSSDVTTALGFTPIAGNQTITVTGAVSGSGTTAISTSFATAANNTVLSNISGIAAAPTSNSLTTVIDTIGSTQGSILYRGSGVWSSLSAGTSGQVLQTLGASANPQWISAVLAFNSRTGNVTLTSGDVTAALGFTPLSGNQTITLSGAITGSGATAITTSLASASNNTILSNISGISAAPSANTVTSVIDTLGNTQGNVLYRNASSWVVLAPGTGGQVLQTQGGSANPQWGNAVLSFNTRSGAVSLTSGDVTTALGFTPLSAAVTSVATGTGLTGGTITSTGTISLAAIASNNLLANTTVGSAAPVATTVTALLDAAIGNVQGDILYRGASTWGVLAPGTKGQMLQTQGSATNPQWGNETTTATAIRLKGNGAGGAKTASWTADQVVAQTALNGVSYKGTTLSFSFNGATTGANGMDTGATPVSGNLAVYAIYNPTSNTWSCLGYAPGAATVAATIYPGANMPAGYTASCLMWVSVTDGSGNIQKFNQSQRCVYVNDVQVLSSVAGSGNTYATLSVASIVPPDAIDLFGIMGGTVANQPVELAIASDTSGSFVSYFHISNPGGGVMDGLTGAGNFGNVPLTTAQQIAWKSFNTTQTNVIKIRGYHF